MNEFIKNMTEKARKNPKRVAFPEAMNVDILRTAEQVTAAGIGFPVLLGKPEAIESLAEEHQISTAGFDYFDYTEEENRLKLAEEYTAGHEDFSAKAVARKSKDPVRCALF